MTRTASALVIGNEILSGKIEEKNVAFLARELRALGIELVKVVVCRDHVGTIAEELRTLHATSDFVFTSGGVGPTHDDVTMEGVAAAFGVPLTRERSVEDRIHAHWKDKVTPDHLRMADVPRGAEQLATEEVPWPVTRIQNVFVLPGVPEIFRWKWRVVREVLPRSTAFSSRAVYARCDEGEIASLLLRIERQYRVMVGSYPRLDRSDYTVKLTFDGTDAAVLEDAVNDCVEHLPNGALVRVE